MSEIAPFRTLEGVPVEVDGLELLGLHEDLSNAAYHGGPGVSKSGLDLIARSPMHYRHARDHRSPNERTASQAACNALELGTVFHTAVLEPHKLEDVCVLGLEQPNGKPLERRSNADKATWAAFEAEHPGKIVCRRGELVAIAGMVNAIREHPTAGPLLDPEDVGAPESSAYWIDPATGVLCRCRPDKPNARLNVLVDLKSTLEADVGSSSFQSFEKSAASHRYHLSDVMSSQGWELTVGEAPRRYVFVVVEKAPPHGIGVFAFDEEARERARELYARDLDIYAWCLARDAWPGYPDEVRPLSLPRWALYD